MSDQFNLFGPYGGEPPAQRHSETSKAAAKRIKGHIGPLHQQILEHLRFNLYSGATDEEMQEQICMSPNTQRPRRCELLQMGKIKDGGRRRLTRSGRWAVVWVLA